MLLFVDGYNLLKTMYPAGADEDVDGMLAALCRYRKSTRNDVVVVFDGYASARLADRESRVGGIKVIYTGRGRTADEKLRALVAAAGPSCVVVSTDRAVAGPARSRGAGSITSEEFAGRLLMLEFKDGVADDDDDESGVPKKGNPKREKKRVRRQALLIKKV